MYLSGLSGGGAVTVSTISANNFTTLEGIRRAIDFGVDYETGPTGNATKYFDQIFENAGAKAEAGFPVTVADTFGQFWTTYLPRDQKFANYSDLALPGNAFSNGDAPMPYHSSCRSRAWSVAEHWRLFVSSTWRQSVKSYLQPDFI
jgi:lysophospholipase